MRIGVILDPLSSIKTYKDTTYAMMAEAARRGHELHFMLQESLMWKGGAIVGENAQLTLTGEKERWYHIDLPRETALREFDAVLMRKDPPFDAEYVASTWLLEQAVREGARVFNDPRAIRDHSEKLAVTEFPQFCVPTLVTRLAGQIHEFIEAHGDVVVKPLDGMGGESVFRVTDTDPNRFVIVETITAHGHRSVMAQRYIPEIRDGDKRILLIAGKPVPYCLARIPKPGETRGNLAAGGEGVGVELSDRDREIVAGIAPWLQSNGILFAGLDVIGDYLTEINITSPTCIRELDKIYSLNISGTLLDRIELELAV